jgi:tetratricopeptide (TPR) repeat protein
VGAETPKDSEAETIGSADLEDLTLPDRRAAQRDAGSLPVVSPEHYAVEGEFARGGMGRVLLARDRRLDRSVALKELHADAGPGAPRRFVREALVTARLQHPAIVPVYEAGRWPSGLPFYAMKMVQGRSLEALIRGGTTLAERLALLPHLIAVAEAVAYAHSQRVVHRDLKPANVLVGPFGETVVLDWGLAKDLSAPGAEEPAPGTRPDAPAASGDRTVAGTVLGTPHYMPPEQAKGLPVDERADVYALGAMLYFLLAGKPPHAGTSAPEVLAAAAAGRPRPIEALEPEAPPDLVAIVHKAMAPEPGGRYPTAQEMAADLRRFQTGQLVSAYRYSAGELLRRFVRRHRAAVTIAATLTAVIILSVIAGFLAVRSQARVAEAQRDRARAAAEKAERINAFVRDMLGSADPRVAGRDVTVASVLDAASARVEPELGGQADVKAAVLSTLGTTYEGLGLFAPAEKLLKAALEARIAVFGPEHVEVARSLNALAAVAEDQGNLKEAERLNRQALAMLQRLGALDGDDAATVKGSLARVLEGLGDSAAAEALYGETLALERRLGGDRSPGVAVTLNNLGVLLGQRGDWAAAEPLHREALDIIRAVRGPEHVEVAAGMNTLGAVLEEKGDLAGAEALYRDGLALRRKLLGLEHPDTTRSIYALAYLLRAKGDPEGAARLCREVLALRGRVLPDAHPMVAAVLLVEGLSFMDLGRAREAEPPLRESLELRRRALPPGHWLIAASESALGACLTALGRYPEAEALLLRGYEGLKASRGDTHERTVEARQRLVVLYEAWDRPGRAAAYRAGSR